MGIIVPLDVNVGADEDDDNHKDAEPEPGGDMFLQCHFVLNSFVMVSIFSD